MSNRDATTETVGPEREDGDSRHAFLPVAGTPPSATSTPSCRHCRHNNGSCVQLCDEVRGILPNDRTGAGRREYTNELDLESHEKPVPVPLTRDFSRLLEEPHLFTPRQLAALRLTHLGATRAEICRTLGVTSGRVSQLVGAAIRRYEAFQARMRAAVAKELNGSIRPSEEENGARGGGRGL